MTVVRSLELPEPQLDLLFEAELITGDVYDIGNTPEGRLEIITYPEGTFKGGEMSGSLLSCSANWKLTRPDGVIVTNAKYMLKTDRGEVVTIESSGSSVGNTETVQERLYVKRFSRFNNTVVIGMVKTLAEGSILLDAYEVN